MKVYLILFNLVFLMIQYSVSSEELICGEKPNLPTDIGNNKDYWKEMDVHDEWYACIQHQHFLNAEKVKIRLGKKRKLITKGFDVKIKNIPKDWEVYTEDVVRGQAPMAQIICPDQLFYLVKDNRPVVRFICVEPTLYNGEDESSLKKYKGITMGKTFNGVMGAKDGKYYREVFEWTASSYKTKNYICNVSCTALVDFEYKEWFLKNIYFRVE